MTLASPTLASNLGAEGGGGGRIRTFEDRSRQIYSLLPLTARQPLRWPQGSGRVISDWWRRVNALQEFAAAIRHGISWWYFAADLLYCARSPRRMTGRGVKCHEPIS